MIELMVRDKTRIDLYSNEMVSNLVDFSVDVNTQGKIILLHKADETAVTRLINLQTIGDVVQVNKFYNLSFRIDRYSSVAGAQDIRIGFNGNYVHASSNGFFEGIVKVLSTEFLEILVPKVTNCEITDIMIESVEYKFLDIIESKEILLSKSRKSFSDPMRLMGDFSKSFRLPSTERNDKFFSNIYKLDAQPRFDVTTTYPAIMRAEGIEVMLGELVLDNVLDDGGEKLYEVQFLGKNTRFLNHVSARSLRELTLDLVTNNRLSLESLKETWKHADGVAAQAAGLDFVYALCDYGQDFDYSYFKGYRPLYPTETKLVQPRDPQPPDVNMYQGMSMKEFKPVFFANFIMDRIHAEAGYTYEGAIFDEPVFRNLVIPVNSSYRKESLVDQVFMIRGIEPGFDFKMEHHIEPWDPVYSLAMPPANEQLNDMTIRMEGNLSTAGAVRNSLYYFPSDALVSRLRVEIEVDGYMTCKDEMTGTVVPTNGDVQIQVLKRLNLTPSFRTKVDLLHEEMVEVTATDGSFTHTFDAILPENYFYSDTNYGTGNYHTDFLVNLKAGISTVKTCIGGTCHLNHVKYKIWNDGTLISTELQPGALIEDASQFMSNNIKQIDFIKSVATMFNLFMDEDDVEKHITYKKFSDYFSNPPKDYTQKIDMGANIRKTFFSNEGHNVMKFTLSDGLTLAAKDYKKESSAVYGSSSFLLNNVRNNKTLSIKSPSNTTVERTIELPYFKTGSSSNNRLNYATLLKKRKEADDETELSLDYDVGLHLLFYRSYDKFQTIVEDEHSNYLTEWHFPVVSVTMKESGAPDNFSINFGDVSKVSGLDLVEPENNLMKSYWNQYFSLMTNRNNYFLEAYFRMTSKDFFEISLSDVVTIDNQKYFIQEVTDFNPEYTTKMKLLRADFSRDALKENFMQVNSFVNIGIGGWQGNKSTRTTDASRVSISRMAKSVTVDASDNVSVGVNASHVKVQASTDVTVMNGCERINVVGSNNVTLAPNTTDVNLINTGNKFVTESNCTWVNGFKFGSNIEDENTLNDAGEDTLQTRFSDAGLEDGCEDGIWDITWENTYQIMDGGVDNKF